MATHMTITSHSNPLNIMEKRALEHKLKLGQELQPHLCPEVTLNHLPTTTTFLLRDS